MAALFSMSGIILLLFITNFSFSPFYHCTASSSYTWRPLSAICILQAWIYLYVSTNESLTICVDVQPNHGPVSPQATKPPFSSFGGSFRHAVNTNLHVSHQDKAVVSYTRLQLLNVRRTRHCSPHHPPC